MAAGKVHVRNITNRTAALLLFMPASVISVLLLKGEIWKIFKPLIYAAPNTSENKAAVG